MAKRRIRIDDLFTIRLVADPQISPDGTRVAYVVTRLDREQNAYRAAIWMLDINADTEPVKFTSGMQQDFSPRWSPDGRYLAFLSNRSGKNQIYVMPTDGGEPWQLSADEDPASDIAWSADGRWLTFARKSGTKDEAASDTLRITTLRHKADGEGFFDGRRRHIFRVSRDGETCEQLTHGDFDHSQPALSSDGTRLAFVANRDDDRDDSSRADVWVQDLAAGHVRRVTSGDGAYSLPTWSSDGRHLAYVGHPIAPPYGPTTLDNLFVWDSESDEVQGLLGGLDREPGNSGMSDCRYNLPNQRPIWRNDRDEVLTLLSDSGSVEIFSCALGEKPERWVGGARDIQSFSISQDGEIVFASSTPSAPTEVFVLHRDGRERQLTNENESFLNEVELATVEEIRFESDPGVEVHGWLLHPPGFNPDARYPAIVQVHGGPHGMYGVGFFHEMQVLAAHGYVVLMTNPRGSTGYGQEWVAGTLGDWGGKDYRDVIAGADALEMLPYVDSDRIGITGGSYGGYMTNWVIGQTDRFKAAVSQRSTANRISLYGTSDLNWSYNDWEFGGTPYDNYEFYRERSPLTYVNNVSTPVLLLHSENDLRCPISQSEEFFTALRKLGKTVEFVRFPDESHGLSRSGQPKHRIERLERLCGWFDRYL